MHVCQNGLGLQTAGNVCLAVIYEYKGVFARHMECVYSTFVNVAACRFQ